MEEHLRPKELVGSSSLSRGTPTPGTVSLEIERKYEVAPETDRPSLVGVAGITREASQLTHVLDATYFDTSTGFFLSNKSALRHRLGGPDAVWHLKTRTAEGGLETHWLTQEVMLAELGVPEQLVPIERIETKRTSVALIGALGDAPLAEFVDDDVTATDLRDGTQRRWREWEIELCGDWSTKSANEFFAALEPTLLSSGASPSQLFAKLQRALGV